MFYGQLVVTGVAQGAILSLAAMGLVLTYRSTGVFNFAHGAIGVLVAYVFFQLNAQWGVPVVLAGVLAVLVVAPAIGLALERIVFRPLQRIGATTTEKLVATLGVFVLLVGLVVAVWDRTTRVGPELIPARGMDLVAGVRLGWDQLGIILLVAGISAGLWSLFRRTYLGTEIRAVVDQPELAELAAVDTNRVAGIAWAMGATLAGLAGVFLASASLDPFRLNLVLIEVFSLAVVGRLTSLPMAVGAGILVLGVGDALLGPVHVFDGEGTLGVTFEQIKPNLSVILLFTALLVYKRLDIVGSAAERVQRLAGGARRSSPARTLATAATLGAGLVVLPGFLDVGGLERAHQFLAFSIIFVSIVAVTGFSGHITLGQAGFAGLGAWASARFGALTGLPVVLTTVLGGLTALVAGLLAGWPALKRKGLFLALTTLALALLIFQVVLQNLQLAGGFNGLRVTRPSLGGFDLDGPVAFYYYELAWVGLMFLFARNLRSGRLGRALGAMRDSEDGSRAVGLDLRAYKLLVFGASAFMAGIGGTLLTQQAEVFTARGQFFPLNNLFWFAVVVVAGVTSLTGAVLGAFLWVMLDVLLDTNGVSQLVIGAGALLLGRLPGGNLMGVLRLAGEELSARARRGLAAAQREQAERARSDPPPEEVYVPSRFAVEALRGDGARSRRRRQEAGSP